MGYSPPPSSSNIECISITIPASSTYTPIKGIYQFAMSQNPSPSYNPQYYDGSTWQRASHAGATDAGRHTMTLYVSANGNFRIYNGSGTIPLYVVFMRWF
ncbi:MAG: hypothetical protein QXE51_03335 [Nitrososphaeria archaeon]